MHRFAVMLRNERLYFGVSALCNGLWPLWGRASKERSGKPSGPFLRFLVIRLDEIGDMVTTLPMLQALKEDNPESRVDLWCSPLVGEWMEGQRGVDRVWKGQAPSGDQIYDVVLECRGNWQSLRYALRTRVHQRRDRGTIRILRRLQGQAQPHEWDINLELAGPWLREAPEERRRLLDLNAPSRTLLTSRPSAQSEAELFLNRYDLNRYAVLHTGARKLLRRWSLHRWSELARRLHEERGLDVVFVGTPDEQGDVERIRAVLNFETRVWMDGRPLSRLIPLLAGAQVMVGNESGPMHLAAAAGCPTVGLFGPGEPGIFSPKVDFFRALHKKLPCNPCGQVRCIHPENPCMNRLEVEEVMAAVVDLLDRRAS
ncbi:MAG: glycosyltransferase family 9 protein [Bacteroidota bacterium]